MSINAKNHHKVSYKVASDMQQRQRYFNHGHRDLNPRHNLYYKLAEVSCVKL